MKAIIPILIVILSITSCVDPFEGQYVTEKFDLPYFTAIETDQNIDIIIHYEPVYHGLEYTLPIGYEQNLDFRVIDDVLVISRLGSIPGRPIIHVYTHKINGIYNYGSSDISTRGNLHSGIQLDLMSFGSGDIDIESNPTKLYAIIEGSGDIEFDGRTRNAYIEIKGSGDFYGRYMQTNTAKVLSDASGDVYLRVFDYLNAEIWGSGDIILRGNPTVDVLDNGSGELFYE